VIQRPDWNTACDFTLGLVALSGEVTSPSLCFGRSDLAALRRHRSLVLWAVATAGGRWDGG
jgi:hypothetical protein